MKNIAILGSSGSIGVQAIDVVQKYPDRFRVKALSVNKNIKLLQEQIKKLKPKVVVVADEKAALEAKKLFYDFEEKLRDIEILSGIEGLIEIAKLSDVDIVLNSLVGSIGLRPTLAAIEAGKTIALANKESLVAGGAIVKLKLENSKAKILPVDSEHNAIFQCLIGEKKEEINKLIITASGGPFRGKTLAELENVTKEQALNHPRWKMGPKITIDSATLMNKGLEVIEAHWLFDLPYNKIEVVVHPQSIIHSMVEFTDGSIKAHLGQTDMRIPIQYALSYPERLPSPLPMLNFADISSLTFEKPDYDNFPCLKYAYQAIEKGKTYAVALNAANEEAVAAFLDDKIRFVEIPNVIYEVLERHVPGDETSLDSVLEAEARARSDAFNIIHKLQTVH